MAVASTVHIALVAAPVVLFPLTPRFPLDVGLELEELLERGERDVKPRPDGREIRRRCLTRLDVAAQRHVAVRRGVRFVQLQSLSPGVRDGNATVRRVVVVVVVRTETWREADLRDGVAGERVRAGEEVERDGAGVGAGVEGEGGGAGGTCCGRNMGCVTHLQLVELVAIAEDVGSDEGERVCEVGVIGVEVVTGWNGIYESTAALTSRDARGLEGNRLTVPCLPFEVCHSDFVLDYCKSVNKRCKKNQKQQTRRLLTSFLNLFVSVGNHLVVPHFLLCRDTIPLVGSGVFGFPV